MAIKKNGVVKNMEIGFRYGVLCDSLEKQANEQGFTLGKKADKFESHRNEIHSLLFGGIITDSMSSKCFEKLQKQVVKSLKRIGE